MSIFGSIEQLAYALHRKGYVSDDRVKVKIFVRLHRVDLMQMYISDASFDYIDMFNALNGVAVAEGAIDCAKAFETLAKEIEKAEDQLTNRICSVIDDIEFEEKEAA